MGFRPERSANQAHCPLFAAVVPLFVELALETVRFPRLFVLALPNHFSKLPAAFSF